MSDDPDREEWPPAGDNVIVPVDPEDISDPVALTAAVGAAELERMLEAEPEREPES